MQSFVYTGGIVIAALYGLVSLGYLVIFRSDGTGRRNIVRICAGAAALIHLIYIVALAASLKGLPLENVFMTLTVAALFVAVTYVFVQFTSGESGTGIIAFPLVCLIQAAAVPGLKNIPAEIVAESQSSFTAALLLDTMGYAAFLISVLYSLMYVLMHAQIKERRFGLIFDRFPSLEALDRLNKRAVAIGILLLSAGLVSGWITQASAGSGSQFEGSQAVSSYILWVIYGGSITSRHLAGWQGRRAAYLSLLGGIVLLATFFAFSEFIPAVERII